MLLYYLILRRCRCVVFVLIVAVFIKLGYSTSTCNEEFCYKHDFECFQSPYINESIQGHCIEHFKAEADLDTLLPYINDEVSLLLRSMVSALNTIHTESFIKFYFERFSSNYFYINQPGMFVKFPQVFSKNDVISFIEKWDSLWRYVTNSRFTELVNVTESFPKSKQSFLSSWIASPGYIITYNYDQPNVSIRVSNYLKLFKNIIHSFNAKHGVGQLETSQLDSVQITLKSFYKNDDESLSSPTRFNYRFTLQAISFPFVRNHLSPIKSKNVTVAKVTQRVLKGTGQHRFLLTTLQLPQRDKCNIEFTESLPSEIYVDVDELNHFKQLLAKGSLHNSTEYILKAHLHTEHPSYMANPMILTLRSSYDTQEINIKIPIHIRYGKPCPDIEHIYSTCTDDYKFREFSIWNPIIKLECENPEHKRLLVMQDLQVSGVIYIKHPVGSYNHIKIVTIVTTVVIFFWSCHYLFILLFGRRKTKTS